VVRNAKKSPNSAHQPPLVQRTTIAKIAEISKITHMDTGKEGLISFDIVPCRAHPTHTY
jgi:hypothetical protein